MSRNRILLLVFAMYVSVASALSLLAVKPAFYGLSTVLGTTILGTTVLGTTVLGTTILGTTVLGTTLLGTTTTTTSLIQVYADALSMGQLTISLVGIGMLVYLELSDPSYGRTRRLIAEVRKSWLPLSAMLVLLFALIVFFRIWAIVA